MNDGSVDGSNDYSTKIIFDQREYGELDFHLGILGIGFTKLNELHFSVGRDTAQDGWDFRDENVLKDRVYLIKSTPEIKIPSGTTKGSFTIHGLEEFPENNEDDELIKLSKTVYNADLVENDTINIVLKNNTLSFERIDNPFINLSNSAISWGDYDRDGDMDLAIMGQSNTVGAVTTIYQNQNGVFVDIDQNFTKVYDGDLSWVDLNKDGWLDLVVSGYNQNAKTDIYLNNQGVSFEPTTDSWGLPSAYNSVMSWGDLDNDGDIDLAFSGLDENDNMFHTGYLRVDGENKFIPTLIGYFSAINGDHAIVDFDQDSDNDVIFSGEYGNEIRSQIKLNSFISPSDPRYEDIPLKYSRDIEENIPVALTNSSITTYFNQKNKELSYILMGRDSNDELKVVVRSVGEFDRKEDTPTIALENGDVAVGDLNNDGFNDFLYTGEDSDGSSITKLFFTTPNEFYESDYEFAGLRESTAEFVDYDSDGDLDILLTGFGENGAQTILYKVNLNSKVNTPPSDVENLTVTDLGYGNIRLDWDESNDDFSNAVGYNVKIATTPGGSELSNTQSDLETGSRLISSPPPIQTNRFETNLYPGVYFISAQSIDPGVKASKFSEEVQLNLFYEWKLLNQGGIEDKYIPGKKNPILKLMDLDGDNDLDLLYGSTVEDASNTGTDSFYKLTAHRYDSENKRLLRIDREAKTEGSLANYVIENITDMQVGKINDDEYVDVIINTYDVDGEKDLYIYLGKENTNNYGEASMALVYDRIKLGDGLYNSKLKISDINNDGVLEIIQIGLTSENTTSGIPKLYIYNYEENTNQDGVSSGSFVQKDISDQISKLTDSSFDIGDYDNDQDIDLIITGFDVSNGLSTVIYNNVTIPGSNDYQFDSTQNQLGASRGGSINFFDMENDGDLDVIITGTSFNGDVFEVYENKVNENIFDWEKLETNIPGLRSSKVDFGDFNGDGYYDLLFSGIQSGFGKISELREFNPSSNRFSKSSFDIGEIVDADVEFGDIDGDGDLDFVLSGTNKNNENYHTISTFLNVRTESAIASSNSANSSFNKESSGSYGMGVRRLSQNTTNNSYVINNPPDVPILKDVKLISDQNGNDDKVLVEFSWNPSVDDYTDSKGLSYSLRIGTSPGKSDVMDPAASDNGFRTIPSKGNAEHNLKWKLALNQGEYFWSVQAVDASFNGSLFGQEASVIISENDIISSIDTDSDGVTDDVDQCPDTPTGETADENGCSDSQKDTDNDGVTDDLDQCSDTPTGETSDENGCSDSQKDTDNDGVTDDIDQCPDTPAGAPVDVNGCEVFILPVQNFKVEVGSATCVGNSDGVINLSIEDASYDYLVTITGRDDVTIAGDSKTASITGLPKGTYTICFKVDGEDNFEQCFEVEVNEPQALSAFMEVNGQNLNITMSGSSQYNIDVNGNTQITSSNNFETVLSSGLNIIKVYTSLKCQGFVEEQILISEEVYYYPNPTQNDVNILVGGKDENVSVSVLTIDGSLIYSREQHVSNITRKTVVDLSKQTSGTYIVVIESETVSQTFKIIKE